MSYKVEDTAEVWKSVKGFEGLYEVSNLGRVRSIDRVVANKNNSTRRIKGAIKTPKEKTYLSVQLWRDNKPYMCLVHRLVADAFIPNPQGLPVVNHRDENKYNNIASNLEWCTEKYNANYGTRNERLSYQFGKRVVQRDYDRNIIKTYNSLSSAARENGISLSSIYNACEGRSKSANGFLWEYENKPK